jgi:hypothetical protein
MPIPSAHAPYHPHHGILQLLPGHGHADGLCPSNVGGGACLLVVAGHPTKSTNRRLLRHDTLGRHGGSEPPPVRLGGHKGIYNQGRPDSRPFLFPFDQKKTSSVQTNRARELIHRHLPRVDAALTQMDFSLPLVTLNWWDQTALWLIGDTHTIIWTASATSLLNNHCFFPAQVPYNICRRCTHATGVASVGHVCL